MTVADLVERCPGVARAFAVQGMACVGCPMARFETVQEVASVYRVPIDAFMEDIARLATARVNAPRRLHPRPDTRRDVRERSHGARSRPRR
jgi:hybrid cluster-associated redox disulfide protein